MYLCLSSLPPLFSSSLAPSLPSRVDPVLAETPQLRPSPPDSLPVRKVTTAVRTRIGQDWAEVETFIRQTCTHSSGVNPKNEPLEIQPIYLEKFCILVILDILLDEPEILF